MSIASLSCLVDLSGRAKYRFTGPDRERYLNGQVSNRVDLATTETSIPACVCNVKGKLDGLVYLTASSEGDALLVDGPGEIREALFQRLDRYLIADDCELSDVSEEFGLIHVLGTLPDLPGARWRNASRFGAPGHDLWTTRDTLDSLRESGHRICGENDPELDTFRIRHGVPRWGNELDETILPAEAGLDRTAVDFHKGCYLGQEVVSRIESVGRVNRTLCLLSIDPGASKPASGDSVFPTDEPASPEEARPVGRITSVSQEGEWALAYLKRDWSASETRLVSRSPDGKVGEVGLEVRTFESGGE